MADYVLGTYSTNNQYVKYRIVVSEGALSGRSRTVTVKVQFWRTNSGYTTHGNGTCYCKIGSGSYVGQAVSYSNSAHKITYNSYTTLWSGTTTINYDTNGNASQSFYAYIDFSTVNADSSAQGGTVTFNNIGAANASFNLNIKLPDGSEPWDTGAAGTVEFSSNGGSSYSRVYNEPASSYKIGTSFKFRNFTPGTGLYLSSVSGASLSGGVYSATLGSGGLTVNFQTAWTQYPLQIDPNGGYRVSDGSTEIITVNKTYGQTEAISERRRANYTLGGYTVKNSNNGSTTDLGGASFTFDDVTKTGTFTQGTVPCTLVANWILDAFTITFENNGGVGGPTSQAINANEAGTLTIQTPTMYGYTFRGWDTSPDAVTPVYLPGDTITLTGNVTLYAIWDVWTYTVAFDFNGGSGNKPKDLFLMGMERGFIGFDIPTCKNAIFVGWNTESNGTGYMYLPGDRFSSPQDGGTIYLYAMYLNTDIYFYKNGTIECIEFIEDQSVTHPQLRKDGRIVASEFIEHDGDIMFEEGVIYARHFVEKSNNYVRGSTKLTVDINNTYLVDNNNATLVGYL